MQTSRKSTPDGFGSVSILLHWTSALFILALIGSGFFAGYASDPATKTMALRLHLPVAGIVLLLTLIRLFWWSRIDTKPAPLEGTPGWQAAFANWVHRGLYILLLLLLASGIAMSVASGLPAAVFGDAAFPDLSSLPPRSAHGVLARLIAGLIILHVAGALFHHWFMKDRTLKRMWFNRN